MPSERRADDCSHSFAARRAREAGRRPEPTEDEITRAVIEHWRKLGVHGSLMASIPNKKAFGQAGRLPDLLVLSPQLGQLTGYIELKRVRGKRSADQLILGLLWRSEALPTP
jgi:hypothetical protein